MTTKNVIIIFFIISVVFTVFVILRKRSKREGLRNWEDDLQNNPDNNNIDWNFLDNIDYNSNSWGGADSEYTEEEWNEINAEFEDMDSGWGG